jgi:hypothetical protein
MPVNHNIGSVSCATMRPEDLIPRFVSELESQKPLSRKHRKLVREIKRRINADYTHDHEKEGCTYLGSGIWDCGMNADAEDYFGTDEADYDLEELFDALNEYCLPYFYFGAHPGDCSDYGYWLSEGWDEDFDGLKVSDLSEVPTGYTGEVMHVNDHGNVSLYAYSRGRRRELWAIV